MLFILYKNHPIIKTPNSHLKPKINHSYLVYYIQGVLDLGSHFWGFSKVRKIQILGPEKCNFTLTPLITPLWPSFEQDWDKHNKGFGIG